MPKNKTSSSKKDTSNKKKTSSSLKRTTTKKKKNASTKKKQTTTTKQGKSKGKSSTKDKISKPESPEKALKRLDRENEKLREEVKTLKETTRAQAKEMKSIQGKMETRIKREEVVMKALKVSSRTKKGEAGVIGDLNSSILKAEKYMLHMGKRIDNILAAIKNHREYLIKLNKKVYKQDARKRIEIEVEIMNNTLSIMALSGFDINKTLFNDVKKLRQMMEKKDVELSKLKKRLERLERKFEDEMERFDFESIFQKSEDIPGYR
jgi:hypothetical protein